MQIRIRHGLLLLCIFLVTCQTQPTLYQELPEKYNEPGKVLSGEEINRLFLGKTWHGRGVRNIQRTYFASDGLLVVVNNRDGYFDNSRRRLVGKWWVDNDRLCIRFDKRQPNCGRCHFSRIQAKLEINFCCDVVSDGKGGFKRITPSGREINHFQKVLVDNPYQR